MIPHVHAELIKKWADGAKIQYYVCLMGSAFYEWVDIENPTWDIHKMYRVKPERVFPKTHLNYTQLDMLRGSFGLVDFANEVIKRHILDTEKNRVTCYA